MSRKVILNITTKVIATVDEGINMEDFINELSYLFMPDEEYGSIDDTEILDYEIIDSK